MIIKEKIEQAKELLKEFDVDCWITFVRESQLNGDPVLAFLSPADVTWHSALIITKSGKAIAVVGEYDKKSIQDTAAYDQVIGFVKGVKEPLQFLLKELNPESIALNYSIGSEICDGITYGMFLTISEILKEIGLEKNIICAENIISALRERKTETELSFISEAIKNTEEIFVEVASFIKPGKTEREIAGFMKMEVKKRGLDFAWEETVCPAVFSGPDNAGAHYTPTDRIVEEGHLLNMDFGVKFGGYCSDMQRTFYIMGNNEDSPPDDVQKGFDVIVKSIDKSKEAMKAGIVGMEIDKIARTIVVENGYDEFPHALGHQLGRFSHDGTALLGPPWEKYARKPYKLLEKNMVFTIEPRLTVPGRGVVTIEEMVLVEENECKWLTTPQKQLLLIRG